MKKRPGRIHVSTRLLEEIETHSYSEVDFEVGGMLFGEATSKKTEITGFVPALRASKEQVSITFTHEVWEEILKVGQEKYPDCKIVGWYHTHPSFGVFMSDYDKFIQANFFASPGQVGLVIDPIAGEMGWFATGTKGSIRELGREPTSKGPSENLKTFQREERSARRLNIRSGIIGIAGVSVGAMIGAGLTLVNSPADLTEAMQQRNSEIANLRKSLYEAAQVQEDLNEQIELRDQEISSLIDEQQLQEQRLIEISETQIYEYWVQFEENLSDLVIRIFRDPDVEAQILELNPQMTAGQNLNQGDMIRIPSVPGLKPSAPSTESDESPEGQSDDGEALDS